MIKSVTNHWEKTILLLATVIFILNYMSFYSASLDGQIVSAVRVWDDLRKHVEETRAVPIPIPDYDGVLKDTWKNPQAPLAGSPWLNEKFTAVRTDIKEAGQPVLTQPKNFLPPQVIIETKPGSVEIVLVPDPKNEAVIDEYVIYRAVPGITEEEVKRISGTETSYTDKSVKPNSEYQYRIAVITEDMNVINREISTPVHTVATTGDFQIVFEMSEGDNVANPAFVVGIKVYKYTGGKDPEEDMFYVRRGDKIGRPVSRFVKENGRIVINPDTKEPVKSDVDFTTNYTLKDVFVDENGKEFIKYLDENGVEHVLKRAEKSGK